MWRRFQCRHKTQNFVMSGRRRLPFWQETPDAGNKLQVLISATTCSLSEAGWKPSNEASGMRQTPVLLWMALCSTRRRSSTVSPEMQTWKRAAGHPLIPGMEKGIITDFAKKAGSQLIKRGKFHDCTCAGLSSLWSHQRTAPACGWICSQPTFLCSLRPESLWPPGSMNCGNVMGRN